MIEAKKNRLPWHYQKMLCFSWMKSVVGIMPGKRIYRYGGSLGILIEAYARKLISEDQLRLYFQQISERKDIWINPDLCVRLLEEIFGPDSS